MFLSERDCQRWSSFDIREAISKANTPTVPDFFRTSLAVGGVARTESKLWDIAVLTLMSHVSRAMAGNGNEQWSRKFWRNDEVGRWDIQNLIQGDKKTGRGRREEVGNNWRVELQGKG